MWRTHRLTNTLGAVGVITVTHPSTPAAVLLGAGIVGTAVFPDRIEQPLRLPHRGPATHSLLACLAFGLLAGLLISHVDYFHHDLAAFSPELAQATAFLASHWALTAAAVFLGTLLHLLGDLPSLSGVPLFWPFIRRDVHLAPRRGRFRVGGRVERTMYVLTLAGVGWFVWTTYAPS